MLYCSVGNRLYNIPVEISRLRCLRSLDISNNKISVLPRELSDIQTLESVIVDVAQMRYPSSGVCMLLFLLVLGGGISPGEAMYRRQTPWVFHSSARGLVLLLLR